MCSAEVSEKKTEAHPIKVLIADDDAPTRILLRAAVSQWGYQVVDASDGEEAWEILQKPDLPQLMIVDWLMPRLDGIDLCRRIKAEMPHHPYIILLTQLSGTTNIVKGLEAGANEFLSKPFNMAELQSRLSVGARIVRYELRVAEKNAQMKQYCSQISEIATAMSGITTKVDDLMKETNEAKLKALQADVSHAAEIAKQLSESLKLNGEE